jgi:hypothetical protein
MALEKVTFEFPDGNDEKDDLKIEVEGNALEFESKEASRKAAEPKEKPEVEIEVVDDTPPKDRNRKPSEPPEEVTEEELEGYSEKVRKRLQHFTKGYHDERRAKEQALRERQELESLAQKLLEENNNLKGTVSKNQELLIEQAKKTVASELEDAKRKYKLAYESGDADAVVAAQEELTTAKMRAEKVNNFKPAPLQEEKSVVQSSYTAPQTSQVDEKAEAWRQDNSWFGTDDEMTSFALGLHQKLVKSGVDPKSDEYYDAINKRMRQVFPENFEEADPEPEEKPKRSTVVAPATRSVAPKKITLTQTQVAIAKRLGVPLELYAKQVAEEMRKNHG